MAGGKHAQRVACTTCAFEGRLTPADRTGEGIENDAYRCPLGHSFLIDWAHGGPPREPAWPPSDETRAQVAQMAAWHRSRS